MQKMQKAVLKIGRDCQNGGEQRKRGRSRAVTHTHTHTNTSLRPKKWPFYREHPKLVLRRASIVEVNTLTRYIEIEAYSEAAYAVWAKNGFHLHVL